MQSEGRVGGSEGDRKEGRKGESGRRKEGKREEGSHSVPP